MSGDALRLVALEHFDFGVEICNGLIHVWMDSRHDDGYEILHALVYHHFSLDVKQLSVSPRGISDRREWL